MNFRSRKFIIGHILDIINFYYQRVFDYTNGGFFQNLKKDGTIYNQDIRHLVSTTRMIYNFSRSAYFFREERFKEAALHGLSYLENVHWQEDIRAFAWRLEGNKTIDRNKYTYGLAFVLLAYANAYKAGITKALDGIKHTVTLLNEQFWLPRYGLYADKATPEGKVASYRGQNANMHACEALIAAYEATDNQEYLDRARQLAVNITLNLAGQSGGLIWEHYHADWTIDWNYHKRNPRSSFRPWGFQPGHQTEWSKLLFLLHQYYQEDWMIEKAEYLFQTAVKLAWDDKNGGLYYSLYPDKSVLDRDKYFWVQAETISAAALLAKKTKKTYYWQWYDKLWEYVWEYFIDHHYGGWFQLLSEENVLLSDDKASAGGKSDYHTIAACFEVLKVI